MNIQQYYTRIREEEDRNGRFLHLAPNEPYMSKTAQAIQAYRNRHNHEEDEET